MTLSELLNALQPKERLCVTVYSDDDTENFFYEGWCNDHRRVISWSISTEYNISIRVAKSVLTGTERTYLGNIVKPFRDRVECIIKHALNIDHKIEWIEIVIKDDETIALPSFIGEHYRGMKVDKRYTLEELGI